jgi:hypothetical protein
LSRTLTLRTNATIASVQLNDDRIAREAVEWAHLREGLRHCLYGTKEEDEGLECRD